ncbi:MAG: response regulator [Polyangiaceae bacterium]|nr:response regulator [Polyangiaceae bacterium]
MTATSGSPPSARTVLLVDDSELTCESVKVTLQDAGFTVFTLNSPFGFIKAVREHRPRVILIDVGLGTMSGTKLVRLARDHSAPRTAIVLYSGRTDAELDRDSTECGADGYISKRLSSGELVQNVKRWAGMAR